jgi:hypothetical protein
VASIGLDKYKRTLARIYSSEYVPLDIVRRGFASTFLVDDSELDEFLKAELNAINLGLGM